MREYIEQLSGFESVDWIEINALAARLKAAGHLRWEPPADDSEIGGEGGLA